MVSVAIDLLFKSKKNIKPRITGNLQFTEFQTEDLGLRVIYSERSGIGHVDLRKKVIIS